MSRVFFSEAAFCMCVTSLSLSFSSLSSSFIFFCESEHITLEGNAVLQHVLLNRTVPKWERRTVHFNTSGGAKHFGDSASLSFLRFNYGSHESPLLLVLPLHLSHLCIKVQTLLISSVTEFCCVFCSLSSGAARPSGPGWIEGVPASTPPVRDASCSLNCLFFFEKNTKTSSTKTKIQCFGYCGSFFYVPNFESQNLETDPNVCKDWPSETFDEVLHQGYEEEL